MKKVTMRAPPRLRNQPVRLAKTLTSLQRQAALQLAGQDRAVNLAAAMLLEIYLKNESPSKL
jgi:hypothetical protein